MLFDERKMDFFFFVGRAFHFSVGIAVEMFDKAYRRTVTGYSERSNFYRIIDEVFVSRCIGIFERGGSGRVFVRNPVCTSEAIIRITNMPILW